MCRRVAHRASSTAASVTGGVADTSLRVADGIVSRMGGSNYGQSVLLCYSVCCCRQSESCLHALLCHTNLCWQKSSFLIVDIATLQTSAVCAQYSMLLLISICLLLRVYTWAAQYNTWHDIH